MFAPKKIVLSATICFLTRAQAAALGERGVEELQVLKIEETTNGTLTWYGGTSLVSSSASIRDISDSPRAVSLGQGDDQCCVSWSKVATNSLQQKDVLPSAQRSFYQCGSGSRVSGQEWNVLLGGRCLS
ncbi:hypothetical protein GQ53DRAFT_762085 [Thozetella sp. PMI_491]|nr:hypothetical protein GQ53DRAFT_762085 [Thozetella sp. PMI_491]